MKLIVIAILLIIIIKLCEKTEGFTSHEIEKKSREIFINKHQFIPNVKYNTIKNALPWVDPVTYNDIYKLSLNNKLNINNIRTTMYNSIK
jgi:hypothetical protein